MTDQLPKTINPAAGRITGEVIVSKKDFGEIGNKIKTVPVFKDEIGLAIKTDASGLIEVILTGAIVLDGSDIHIEPEKEKSKIRIRIDGLLQDVTDVDHKIYKILLSRIKLLSGLKLNIANRPQDGRFSIVVRSALSTGTPPLNESAPIEVRVSSIPAEYGESLVLRILNPKSLISLEELGMRNDLFKVLEKEISRPNGMIIVTGPTGSGKTTTLYAILQKIKRPEIKIITLEDPIEYHLNGVSQTQIEPERGYDFANGLKAILRQDPDVILVGEVRDLATAANALQASLTGHLVLTTMHTNDSAGTISRFVALGEKPANIAPAINIAMAQRLIRKVCPYCSKKRPASKEEAIDIEKSIKNIPEEIFKPENKKPFQIAEVSGCKKCNFTGYKGRVGIFEVFSVDDEMERFILTNPPISSLKSKSIEKGMLTMRQDGIIKVIQGLTTIKELERIAEE